MESLYLVVDIAGERIALPADMIESVVEIEQVTPVPLVSPHIAGLSALRSRVMTIVDSLAALKAGRSDLSGISAHNPLQAVVVVQDGHLYGILVDQVEDVVTTTSAAESLRLPLKGEWCRVARGTIEVDDETILLADPAAIIAGPSQSQV